MYITLCNTQFDRENDNVLLFDSKASLKTYFDNLANKVPIVKEINFDAKDIISTSVYVDVPSTTALLQLLNYNYCFLDQSTGQNTSDRLYYFIERSYQDSGNRIRLDLRLDWWNTYAYDIMGANKPLQAMIQKTHLDRYIQSGDDYIYNFKADSPLFERETIKDVAKRAVSKQRLKVQVDKTAKDSAFNNFLNNYVSHWVYYFINPNPQYTYKTLTGTTKTEKLNTLSYIKNKGMNGLFVTTYTIADLGLVVLCAPVYKVNNNKRGTISIMTDIDQPLQNMISWGSGTVEGFIEENNAFANIASVKISMQPPLFIQNYIENTDYKIVENENEAIMRLKMNDTTSGLRPLQSVDVAGTGCLCVEQQEIDKDLIFFTENDLSTWKNTKTQIKTTYKEPKLENEDYASYRIVYAGYEQELPISKTSNKPQFIYRETITPDITKAILIYDTQSNVFTDNVFKDITKSDFTGLQFTVDLSLWYYTDQLQTYLANNKNYLQIFKNEQREQLLKSTVTAGFGSIAKENIANLASGLQLVNTAISLAFDKAKLDLSLDNMRNAPGQFHNINSNPMLMSYIADFGIYIERLEALPFEQELVKDNLKMFGYSYNRIGDIYTHIKTRKYYNYIQAIIFDIDAHISEQVKDIIKQSFRNGIRIWHADAGTAIDFTKNNYERFLDNE